MDKEQLIAKLRVRVVELEDQLHTEAGSNLVTRQRFAYAWRALTNVMAEQQVQPLKKRRKA